MRLRNGLIGEDLTTTRGKLSVGQFAEKTRRNILTQRSLGSVVSFHGNYKAI